MKYLIYMVFLVCAGAAAAVERPNDFAYGIPLVADGREALYEIVLPADVYRGVARADLGDVRVFNGTDEVVPYALRPRHVESAAPSEPVALTLFPLKAQAGTRVDGLSIRVQRRADGTSTVNVATSDARGGETRTIGYFIDVTGRDQVLREIEFDWQNPPDGFAGKLRIDASDDLSAWRTVIAGAPLVSLEVAGQRLEQKRIELPGIKTKYLRLSWVAQVTDAVQPELTAARGEFSGKTVEVPREWTKIEAAKSEKPGEYPFDLRGHFPTDRLRLDLPEPNTVVQVEFLSRDRLDRPWRPVARGVIYRLRQGESEITSPDVTVGANTDRYWLARVDQRGGGVGGAAPKLEAGWVPHRLVFAARGRPPFELAYGSREAKPTALSVSTLIPGYRDEDSTRVRAAATGAQQTVNVAGTKALAQKELGGETRREESIDWKRWSLWGALILGVLVLGGMAWRLMSQLNRNPEQD